VDIDVASHFMDEDGDKITYTMTINLAGADGTWRDLKIVDGHVVGVPTLAGHFTNVAQSTVTIDLNDGHGGTSQWFFALTIFQNKAPVVTRPNIDHLVGIGAPVDYEVTDQGRAFSDADGDALSYDVEFTPLPLGLTVTGTRVHGALNSNGAVYVHVKALDGFGGVGEDVFAISAPFAEERRPNLPTVSYVYDDTRLTLPIVVQLSREHFAPLWDTQGQHSFVTDAGATLGRVLFYDRRLSITNRGSCASCHHQENGFAAPERFSAGPQGELTKRNVMALTGVRYNLDDDYFFDRRAHGLEHAVLLPIEEPTELGISMPILVEKLRTVDFYPPLFEAAFGTPEINPDRIANALSQFLRSLIGFDTRFDKAYHLMNPNDQPHPEAVLTVQELRGSEIFNGSGHCFLCHAQGAQTMDRLTNDALDIEPLDPGAGSGNFRTTSLRNVAVTAPFMHDGRFATLREVIDHYNSGVVQTDHTPPQLSGMGTAPSPDLNLSEEDKDALEAFLDTLTDHGFLTDPRFSDPFQ